MASNGFFEFLGDLKGLYDEASRRRNWAQQYNPYNGGSSWWRGLGAINQMMDRNAEDRALKAQRQEYKAGTDNTPTANVGIGVDANGFHGIGDMESMINAKPTVSISAGSYGNSDVTPKPNKFSFNESDYVPSAGNGYHLGDYPQTEMYGDPTDYQRQMAANAIGYNLGSLEPRQKEYFPKTSSQNDNSFASIFSGKGFNGGSLANPSTPSVSLSNSLAQGTEGQSNTSARDLSRYLSNDYNIANWMQADEGRGVSNPYISALRYASKIAPLVQAAREDDMRNAFITYNSESATPEQKADAIAKLAYYTKTPDLADNIQSRYDNDMYRRGYVRDNSDVGSNILSAFKDYEEGEQWMSPDGTGDSRTQCSNFVSDVLRKVGLNIGSPNGDELMKQFGKAYHTGLDGIQAGDVLNFKDHVGFYVGNGQYIARNSSGGVHQGSMEEAIKAFGQPLGYASVREYAAGVPRYRRDTSKESLLGLKHKYRMAEIEARNGYRNPKNGTSSFNTSGKNQVGLRRSAMDLAGLQNVSAEDTKGQENYNKAINDYAKNIAGAYDLNGSSMDSVNLGIALYKKLNEDKSGLRPESLSRAVATAIYLSRGDVDAGDLQRTILRYIYNEGKNEQTGDNGNNTGNTNSTQNKGLADIATSSNPKDIDEREQRGALNELDEVRDYNDTQPIVTSLGDVASFVKNGGQIGDGKIGDQLVGMVENAGTSKVIPKRRNR